MWIFQFGQINADSESLKRISESHSALWGFCQKEAECPIRNTNKWKSIWFVKIYKSTKYKNSKIRNTTKNTKEGQSNSPECNETIALSEVLSVQCLTSWQTGVTVLILVLLLTHSSGASQNYYLQYLFTVYSVTFTVHCGFGRASYQRWDDFLPSIPELSHYHSIQ